MTYVVTFTGPDINEQVIMEADSEAEALAKGISSARQRYPGKADQVTVTVTEIPEKESPEARSAPRLSGRDSV